MSVCKQQITIDIPVVGIVMRVSMKITSLLAVSMSSTRNTGITTKGT